MQAIELIAAIYAIERARESFKVAVTIPDAVAGVTKMCVISNDVHSVITSKPIKINDKKVVVSGEVLATLDGMKTHYYRSGAEHRVQNFLLHVFDGVNCIDADAVFMTAMHIAREILDNPQVASNIVLMTMQQAENNAAKIKELTERVKLLSETKE
jgi:hypothetical protein